MSIIENARAIREIILEASKKLEDKIVSKAPDVLARLKEDGSLIKAGTRINWNGVIKRASVDLWDIAENNPDAAPTVWEDIEYRKGIRIIPEVITATAAFALDELGWWNDEVYRSKVAGNVYTPDVVPDNWELQR